MTNVRITEVLATPLVIAPSNQGVGAIATAGHQLALFRKHVYTLVVGAMGNNATVDMKLQASTDNTGVGAGAWNDIPGSSIATLTASNVAQVEVQADRIQALNLGTYVRCVVTVGVAACQTCLLVQAGDARYLPASDFNVAGMPAAVLI